MGIVGSIFHLIETPFMDVEYITNALTSFWEFDTWIWQGFVQMSTY